MSQKLFNIAVLGVVAQGAPSINVDRNACMYRGPNGLKCAVGHMIADEHFDPALNVSGISSKVVHMVAASHPGEEFSDVFLADMQLAHDNPRNEEDYVSGFLEEARLLARIYNLEMPDV